MKKFLLLAAALCFAWSANAQQVEGEEGELVHDVKVLALKYKTGADTSAMKPFEGEIVQKNYYSWPKIVEKFGGAYSGAQNVKTIIKGNKVLTINETEKSYMYQLPDKNEVITYYALLKKGYKQAYKAYNAASATEVTPQNNQQQMKFMYTGKTVKYLGHDCKVYSAKTENNEGGAKTNTTADIYMCTDYQMGGIQQYGAGAMPLKILIQANTKTMLMKINILMAYDTKSVTAREVKDSEFDVPTDIEWIEATDKKILELKKDNIKAMKKKDLLPETKKDDVSFNINEDWNF